jgi:hypothetical protein
MTTNWQQVRDHIGERLAGVAKIIFDLVPFFAIAGIMILEERGTEWVFGCLGSGHLFTKAVLAMVGALLDLCLLIEVTGWVKTDIRSLFK